MSGKKKDLLGKIFGRLTVVKFSHISSSRQANWICKCECGNEKMVIGASLIRGATKSCGCLKIKDANIVHHLDGGITAIEINSDKYGQHFTLIDTIDYKRVEGRKFGIRCTGELTKKLYARIITTRKENNGNTSKDLHIFLFSSEVPNGQIIDHINNEDTLDNRRQNIRVATRQQNTFNSVKPKSESPTSKYKGVGFNKNNKFVARITHGYKSIYLGSYKTQEDAAIAYNNAAVKYFGDFAKLNIIT